jgi:hypothetical protein
MQPTYLPWAGYFNLINSVDTFVFLDDVQFNRDSWQVHNVFLCNKKTHKLIVPVVKASLKELICNINIDNSKDWQSKHIDVLHACYSSNKYGDCIVKMVSDVLMKKHSNLSNLNIDLIKKLSSLLGIESSFVRSSNLDISTGGRGNYVESICREVGCDSYLSPVGAKKYLLSDGFDKIHDVSLTFQDFNPDPYLQESFSNFESHLSIIDVIANIGSDKTKSYIK